MVDRNADSGENTTIGARIRLARLLAGLSQAELARRVGVSGPMLGQVELGAKTFSLENAAMAARALGVSLDWLVLGAGLEPRLAFHGPTGGGHDATEQSTAGFRIRAARRRLGLTQAQLASAAGVNRVHVTQIELGERIGSAPVLSRVASALGMSLDWIVGMDRRPTDRMRFDDGTG